MASPLVGERAVAAVSTAGRVVFADLETGEELAALELPGSLGVSGEVDSSPALAAGGIVLGTGDGRVMALGE